MPLHCDVWLDCWHINETQKIRGFDFFLETKSPDFLNKLIQLCVIFKINTRKFFLNFIFRHMEVITQLIKTCIIVTQLCINKTKQYHWLIWQHTSSFYRTFAVNRSPSTTITMVSPADTSPCKMIFAVSVSTCFCTYRFNGRAPYTGSYPCSVI